MADPILPVLHYRTSTLGSPPFYPEAAPLHRKEICKAAGQEQVPSSTSPNNAPSAVYSEVLPRVGSEQASKTSNSTDLTK